MNNNKGFTLIELIAVMVIIGILTAFAVPKYIDLTASADRKGVQFGLVELNARIHLAWINVKLGGETKNYKINSDLGAAFILKPKKFSKNLKVRIRVNRKGVERHILTVKKPRMQFGSAIIKLIRVNGSKNTSPRYNIKP